MVLGKDDESFASLFERSASTPIRRRVRPGERLEVKVVVIGQSAVFADLGGKQEGYFDAVELADKDGKLTVSVGAQISAVVASVDDQTGQVRLSPVFVRTQSAEPEGGDESLGVVIPKTRSTPLLIEGAHVKGKVTGIERYGVFVQIDNTQGRGGRGLIPSAETATPRGADLKKHFTVGQELETKILNIAEDGKIRLSIKALAEDSERGDYDAFEKSARATKDKPAQPRTLGTLGDLFNKRKR